MPANLRAAVRQGDMHSSTVAISSGDNEIDLGQAYSYFHVKLSAGSSSVHLSISNATGTTSMYLIDSGGSFEYEGTELIRKIRYFGNGAIGNISVIAY